MRRKNILAFSQRSVLKVLLLTIVFGGVIFRSSEAQHRSIQIISEPGVFFFGPSLAEADSVDIGDSEALNNFANYSNKIAAFVRKQSMKCEYISARQIHIPYATVKVFMLSRDTVAFGIILTDGIKKPLLLKYVVTDMELKEQWREYFHRKQER